MKLPRLNEYSQSKDVTETFLGLNRNLRTSPGEWSDMKNMTTDNYPVASTRDKRSVQVKQLDRPNMEMCAFDCLNEKIVTLWKNKTVSDGGWLLVKNINDTNEIETTDIDGRHTLNKKVAIKNSGDSSTIIIRNFGQLSDDTLETYKNMTFSFYCESTNFTFHIATVIGDITEHPNDSDISITTAGAVDFLSSSTLQLSANMVYIYKNVDFDNCVYVKDMKTSMLKQHFVKNASYLCIMPEGLICKTNNSKIDSIVSKIQCESTIDGIVYQLMVKADNEFGYDVIPFNSTEYRQVNGSWQKYLNDSGIWLDIVVYSCVWGTRDEVYEFDEFNVNDSVEITYSCSNESTYEVRFGPVNKVILKMGEVEELTQFGVIPGTLRNKKYILFEGSVDGLEQASSNPGKIEIKRKMPDIKFACESQNRVWGCSKDGHEIYASALGNPYNWYDYSGLSTDSYAVNVGTDGVFTGCCNFLGLPLFFKENALHMISGNYPEQYVVTTFTDFKGVEKGSEKSFGIIDNILYYKSYCGIVAFDGAATTVISEALGNEHYKNAAAGVYKNKYYVSMQDSKDEYHLFVYDTKKGLWSCEDGSPITDFVTLNNELLYIQNDNRYITSVNSNDVFNSSNYAMEEDFEWYAETGTFGYSYPNNKYLSRFQIRMKLAQGARASFYIQYNSDGVWHRKGEMCGQGVKSFLVPIVPMRCDHMKIKIEGKGEAKIYSISKVFEEGGDQ